MLKRVLMAVIVLAVSASSLAASSIPVGSFEPTSTNDVVIEPGPNPCPRC